MPKVTVSKESLEGKAALPGGMFTFRVDGWKPKLSKDGKSVNLQPQLRVINHAQHNDAPIYENLNSQAGWVQRDFVHSLGVKMDGPDELTLPGEFQGPDGDPSQWKYIGPIVGRTGQCELVQVPGVDKNGNATGKPRTVVKRYLCAVPGCTVKHTESLV